MKKALIISLSPNIGHLSHVVAYYKLFEEIGFKSVAYVLPSSVSFLPTGLDVITEVDNYNEYYVAIMYSPCKLNLKEVIRTKLKSKCKLIYVYHEPLGSKKSFRDAGVSWLKTQKIFLTDKANWLLVKMADHVILSSKTALSHYENGVYSRLNPHYTCMSLIFNDEYDTKLKNASRKFFSYIGTVAADHSFTEYLDFVKWAVKENKLPQTLFLIATKSDFEVPQELLDSPRVTIQKGRPLSDEEINEYYASTFVVWNAYARTTQSGVLAKSFMFGTPAIVLRKNLSEFTMDGKEVKAIDDNRDSKQIHDSVLGIISEFEKYSRACRSRFENSFYYRIYNTRMKDLLDGIS